MTQGLYLGQGDQVADELLGRFDEVTDRAGEVLPANGGVQYQYEVARALDMVAEAR